MRERAGRGRNNKTDQSAFETWPLAQSDIFTRLASLATYQFFQKFDNASTSSGI